MRSPARLAALLCAAVAAGCGLLDPDGGERAALDDARARWASSGMTAYRTEETRVCFCAEEARGPVTIRVSGGAVQRTYADGRAVAASAAPLFPTVAELFEEIESALDEGAHQVDARYDPVTGAPLEVYIDRDERVIDEEVRWILTPPRAL